MQILTFAKNCRNSVGGVALTAQPPSGAAVTYASSTTGASHFYANAVNVNAAMGGLYATSLQSQQQQQQQPARLY